MNKVVLFTASKVCEDPIEVSVIPPIRFSASMEEPAIRFAPASRRVLKTFSLRRSVRVRPDEIEYATEHIREVYGDQAISKIVQDQEGAVILARLDVAFDNQAVEEWLTTTQKKNEELSYSKIELQSKVAELQRSIECLRSHWYGRLALWLSGRHK